MDEILERLASSINNLSEEDKQQEEDDLKKFQEKTERMNSKTKQTVKSLRAAARELDIIWRNCKIVHATGTTAGIVGGVLTIGGGIATVMTAGAATPLLIAGMAIGGAGASTNLMKSFVESSMNSVIIKKAEKHLGETLDSINDVEKVLQGWLDYKEQARLLYIFFLAKHLKLNGPIMKILKELAFSSLGINSQLLKLSELLAVEAGQSGAKATSQVGEQATTQGSKQGIGKAGDQSSDDVTQAGGTAGVVKTGSKAGSQSADDVVKAGSKAGAQSADDVVKAGSKAGAQSVDDVVRAGSKAGAQSVDDVVKAGSKAGVQSVDDAVKAGSRAGVQSVDDAIQTGSKTGLEAGGKFAGKVIIGVSALFVMFDAIDLSFTINDLIQNKGSDAAKFLREKADELDDAIVKQ